MNPLIPLRKEDLGCLRELLEARAVESNLDGRSDVDAYFRFLENGYVTQIVGAYVDDFVDPKVCLIMMHHPDIFSSSTVSRALLTYVDPSLRGKENWFPVLLEYAENYSRLNGAKFLYASSWVFRGAQSISSLLVRAGFEEQEIVFTKQLT